MKLEMSLFELNTLEIRSALYSNQLTFSYVGQVCAANQLVAITPQKPKLFVVNTQNSNQIGEHWVCFYVPENGPSEFFDSLGKHPSHYHQSFEDFLVNNTNYRQSYLHNIKAVQSQNSRACGFFVLFYCALRCDGFSFRDIMSFFDKKNLDNSTELCVQFVKYNY